MRSTQPIFLDPGQPLAGGVGQIDLRRLRLRRTADHQRLPGLVHCPLIDPAQFGQPRNMLGLG
jgi:hypothetical protein